MSVFAYIHIPKTGGTTLKSILKRQSGFKNILEVNPLMNPENMDFLKSEKEESFQHFRYKTLTEEDHENISKFDNHEGDSLIMGHFSYGIHNLLKNDCYYFTFLRNPVTLIVSLYNEMFRSPDPFDVALVKSIGSLQEFSEKVRNLQTMILSGNPNWSDVKISKELILENVKSALTNEIRFTGIIEQYDLSLILLKEEFPIIESIWYKKLNKNPQKHRPIIDKSIIASIEKNNQLDIKLYNFAKDLLLKKAHSSKRCKQKLFYFKIKNLF